MTSLLLVKDKLTNQSVLFCEMQKQATGTAVSYGESTGTGPIFRPKSAIYESSTKLISGHGVNHGP